MAVKGRARSDSHSSSNRSYISTRETSRSQYYMGQFPSGIDM